MRRANESRLKYPSQVATDTLLAGLFMACLKGSFPTECDHSEAESQHDSIRLKRLRIKQQYGGLCSY